VVAEDAGWFGEGAGAEAAGIETVACAVDGGLRKRARMGLARGGAAAGVCVIAAARDPGAGRLRVRRGREKQGRKCQPHRSNRKCNLSHLNPPDVTEFNISRVTLLIGSG